MPSPHASEHQEADFFAQLHEAGSVYFFLNGVHLPLQALHFLLVAIKK
jgi:hypothetical protein